MSKRQGKKSRFKAKGDALARKANNRIVRKVKEELPLLQFSFKDFQYNKQIPPGQTYETWQEEKLLAYMFQKFGHICNENLVTAQQKNFLKIYGDFPSNSKFENPFPSSDLQWAVIMKISGQKGRVAGYINGNVFYVVFLDKEHLFFPSKLKNT